MESKDKWVLLTYSPDDSPVSSLFSYSNLCIIWLLIWIFKAKLPTTCTCIIEAMSYSNALQSQVLCIFFKRSTVNKLAHITLSLGRSKQRQKWVQTNWNDDFDIAKMWGNKKYDSLHS